VTVSPKTSHYIP